MDNNKVLLTGLGLIGLGALYMSLQSKENIKENYAGGMPQLQAGVQKLAVQAPKNSNMKASLNSVENKSYPNPVSLQNYYSFPTKTKENFMDDRSTYLGSSANTNLPFISQSNYNQSTLEKAPSVQYGSFERYRPTTLDNMGRTDAFNCPSGKYVNSVEGYTTPYPNTGGVDGAANSFPGVNYAAGNYNELAGDTSCADTDYMSSLPVEKVDMLSSSGGTAQVMVYDRPYTTTLKAGRTNMPGVIDYIRGDLPICVDTSTQGWFSASGRPTDLFTGALSAIAGTNEAASVLTNMKATYGSLNKTGGGVSLDQQHNANYVPLQMANMNSGINGNNLSSTAFP